MSFLSVPEHTHTQWLLLCAHLGVEIMGHRIWESQTLQLAANGFPERHRSDPNLPALVLLSGL